MAETEHNQQADDTERRRELAFDANFEIQLLSDLVKKLAEEENSEPRLYAGLMSRIHLCSDVVYQAQRLCGSTDQEAGRMDIDTLERHYKGHLV